MSKPQLPSLESLVASIKQRRTQPARPKPKLTVAEAAIAEALACKIAEDKWRPARLLLLTTHQHCNCGADYRAVMGLYLETRHSVHNARRLRQASDADARDLDSLPHAYEELNETIDICPNCLLERDLAAALVAPVHDCTVQLPLFDHCLQQRIVA